MNLRFNKQFKDCAHCLIRYFTVCLQLASWAASPDAMASSHGSSPVPRGGRGGIYRKERDAPPARCRSVRSLPDVCPKEPTGGNARPSSMFWSSIPLCRLTTVLRYERDPMLNVLQVGGGACATARPWWRSTTGGRCTARRSTSPPRSTTRGSPSGSPTSSPKRGGWTSQRRK